MDKYKQCNIVLTTNFDDMIADALYLYTYRKPLVIFHEALAAFVKITDPRPIVIKLHGDSKLSPQNTKEEIESAISEKIAIAIKNIFSETGIIFIGYGGNDSGVLSILNAVSQDKGSFPWGIYWVGERIPQNAMGEFLRTKKAIWVKNKDFDELMLQLKEALELELPTIDRFKSLFKGLSDNNDSLTKRVHAKPDSDEKKLLEEAARKASQELKISTEPIYQIGGLSMGFKTPTGLQSAIEAISQAIQPIHFETPTGLQSAIEAIPQGTHPIHFETPTGLQSTIEAIFKSWKLTSLGILPNLQAIMETPCLPKMASTNFGFFNELETSKEELSKDMKTSKDDKITDDTKEMKESSE